MIKPSCIWIRFESGYQSYGACLISPKVLISILKRHDRAQDQYIIQQLIFWYSETWKVNTRGPKIKVILSTVFGMYKTVMFRCTHTMLGGFSFV